MSSNQALLELSSDEEADFAQEDQEPAVEDESNNILNLNNLEVRAFLLKGTSYCSIDLPPYFDFNPLIKAVVAKLGDRDLTGFCRQIPRANGAGTKGDDPSSHEDVDYKLINNKDGRYAWRPFQLIHPAIYVSLVHKITEAATWTTIVNRFREFAGNPKICCLSIPIESKTKRSDKAEMVSHWWHDVEQKSIEIALDYQYLTQTDITDCYGAIYTHSVAWAMHDKEVAKARRDDRTLIGNVIDKNLQAMSNGQTNGIPQGSVLMDFIAEMILGYADLQLSRRLASRPEVIDYQILRYRDDYRIFTNNPSDGEMIVKLITEILIELGLKVNPQKTYTSGSVIRASVKEDKIYWINNIKSGRSLQKHLLIIHTLAIKHPNSGSLAIALSDFYKRVAKYRRTNENVTVLISIITDIAYKNPRIYPIASAILSKLISFLSDDERDTIVLKVKNRFQSIPNTGLMDLWLQRITCTYNRAEHYNEPLCKVVVGEDVPIWGSDWLRPELGDLIVPAGIIDQAVLESMKPVIRSNEFSLFDTYPV
ncbi:RNA-directed DNA polymerase [Dyadobacter chenwenxiniae]|uniref:RNA-directed DNA polymerase n=1 Tax=Dyadobacter chenwenxiniae TaxID=2906456 RepID=A0A9X1PJL8_9BACT|nr:RNA-directed DNA polymerase [Dyadobacter chenwenxiniae]MCF0061369.1 RNA-directed DNA polymerase [Dyadobacter chenwenxiniae]UON81191.1 RNA-directed DNA polymerase [Dyadobacter chenwenxiniae]